MQFSSSRPTASWHCLSIDLLGHIHTSSSGFGKWTACKFVFVWRVTRNTWCFPTMRSRTNIALFSYLKLTRSSVGVFHTNRKCRYNVKRTSQYSRNWRVRIVQQKKQQVSFVTKFGVPTSTLLTKKCRTTFEYFSAAAPVKHPSLRSPI